MKEAIANKACPVILRKGKEVEILVFKHPLAGIQLVKGSIEVGESSADAALRELAEEAGILNAQIVENIGLWQAGYDQVWAFYLCKTNEPLLDSWTHFTSDDGGRKFEFFWHPVFDQPSQDWHDIFSIALSYIRCWLTSLEYP